MRKCKITVLRKLFYKDLSDEYVKFPFGPCDQLNEGDVFYTGGLFGADMPAGFCAAAWDAIAKQATVLAFGGKAYGFDERHVMCCNDGVRPVIFLLEPEDDGKGFGE